MESSENTHGHHFDIHPSVVLRLGDELITDIPQALVEIVKNSYDADASYARVVVDTESNAGAVSYFSDAKGYILIEDDGIGMDEKTIQRGWLTISNSPKREIKSRGGTTGRGRTPLGDKGLGRLCAQRLGENIDIFTCPKGSDIEYHVAFSWNEFRKTDIALTEVAVHFIARPAQKSGTRIIISGLKEPEAWSMSEISSLEMNLSQLISPYKEVANFMVVATVNGKRLDFAEYSDQLKRAAILHYRLDFDGEELVINGMTRFRYFVSSSEEETIEGNISRNNGNNEEDLFFDYLLSKNQARRYETYRMYEDNWYVGYKYKRKIYDIVKPKLINGKIANPGKFYGEVDSFNFSQDKAGLYDVFGGSKVFKGIVKNIGGIRVFRDGFGIRVGEDWLGLSKQQTSAKSYYGLKPENIVGYIALSAKNNSQLEETTNRESFKSTSYYDNFYLILLEFVKFTLDAQSFLRRSWNEFKREQKLPAQESPVIIEEVAARIRENIIASETHATMIKTAKEPLREVIQDTQKIEKFLQSTPDAEIVKSSDIRSSTQSIASKAERALINFTQAEKSLPNIDSLRRDYEALENQIVLLRNQISVLKEQISLTYETVSLGLTVEALSHEMVAITDQLAQRNRQVVEYLKNRNSQDLQLTLFTQYINSAITALRKQLSHISPALRYVRENKETISVDDYFKEVEEFYRSRFANYNIETRVIKKSDQAFLLFMNKGKLNQIVDNLLINSEYWLREDLGLKRLARGIITIEIARPFVRVSDNGRGIEPSVEESLFEPFVTVKRLGQGRGLGLFIVQQLLDSENCSISLSPVRNKDSRLSTFEIDFNGGLHGK